MGCPFLGPQALKKICVPSFFVIVLMAFVPLGLSRGAELRPGSACAAVAARGNPSPAIRRARGNPCDNEPCTLGGGRRVRTVFPDTHRGRRDIPHWQTR